MVRKVCKRCGRTFEAKGNWKYCPDGIGCYANTDRKVPNCRVVAEAPDNQELNGKVIPISPNISAMQMGGPPVATTPSLPEIRIEVGGTVIVISLQAKRIQNRVLRVDLSNLVL